LARAASSSCANASRSLAINAGIAQYHRKTGWPELSTRSAFLRAKAALDLSRAGQRSKPRSIYADREAKKLASVLIQSEPVRR
jgi:hypothetical protein